MVEVGLDTVENLKIEKMILASTNSAGLEKNRSSVSVEELQKEVKSSKPKILPRDPAFNL